MWDIMGFSAAVISGLAVKGVSGPRLGSPLGQIPGL